MGKREIDEWSSDVIKPGHPIGMTTELTAEEADGFLVKYRTDDMEDEFNGVMTQDELVSLLDILKERVHQDRALFTLSVDTVWGKVES